MKTYNFSKEDLEYLSPVEATKQALNTAVQVYILNTVFPRLGLKTTDKVEYDVKQGTLKVLDVVVPDEPPKEVKKEEAKTN